MRTLVIFALGTSLVATACAAKDKGGDGEDSPSAAVDSQEGVQSEGDLMMSSMEGASSASNARVQGAAPTATDVAAVIAANIGTRLQPAGCASVQQSGANLTIDYSDCSGPYGLVHVTGELDLSIAVALDGTISAQATGTNVEVNGATLDIDATGVYQSNAGTDTLTVTSHGSGVGPLGNDIDHDGQYTISWDTANSCHSIDGSWATEFSNSGGSAERSNTVDIQKCEPGCPNGSMSHTYLGGIVLSLDFNGTSTATWSLSTGQSGTFAFTCE